MIARLPRAVSPRRKSYLNKNNRKITAVLLSTIAAALLATGCTITPKTAGEKAVPKGEGNAALASFKAKDPSLQQLLDKPVG